MARILKPNAQKVVVPIMDTFSSRGSCHVSRF